MPSENPRTRRELISDDKFARTGAWAGATVGRRMAGKERNRREKKIIITSATSEIITPSLNGDETPSQWRRGVCVCVG